MKRTAIAFVVAVTLACDRPVQARSTGGGDDATAQTTLKVDSIMPSAVALRRFQSDLPPVSGFSGAVRNRDDLVARFVRAIENGDTAVLEDLLVTKGEYAFLYFPSSVYSRRPYELPPEIAWLLSEQNSVKGLTRLTRRLGGNKLHFRGYECSDPVIEGANRFWRSCLLTYTDPASRLPVTRKLFGAIMERDGRYKFLSYANDF